MSSIADQPRAGVRPGARAPGAAGSAAPARWGWLGLAALIYLGFAIFLTWPLATHLGNHIYAASPPGDPIGSISTFRNLIDDHQIPFLPGTLHQLAAPEGQAVPWIRNLAAFPGVLVQWLLSLALGAVPALGVYTLLGYVASGLTMFAFVRRLTGNPWSALVCGWAFAFFPFAVLNGQGHSDYIQGWVFVLATWRMVELQWEPTRRNAVLAALAAVLALWWTQYFILFEGVAFAAAIIAGLAIAARDRCLRLMVSRHALAGGIVAVFVAALAALSTATSAASLGLNTNGLAEFNTYSARPLEYLIPDARNPILGGDTAGYLTAHIHGSNVSEATLYLGATVLVLALLGLIAGLRRATAGPVARAVVMLAFVGLVAAICSAPPQARILGVTVDFPAHFIMKATTTWRVYSRFVIVVMMAATALAGVGLDWLSRRRRTGVRYAILAAAAVLVVVDLWARLPHRTYTTGQPTAFRALARQPGRGLVAEYPLVPNGSNFYWDVFYQHTYDRPLINGYLTGSLQEHRALSLANLALPTTAGRLASLGVRYVVVESGPSPYGLPPAGTPGAGFRKLTGDGFATLYRVTARPSGPALPAAGDEFGDDETGKGGVVSNWLEQPRGTIGLAGTCVGCRGELRMTLSSFARPRTVAIAAGGRVLWRRRVTEPTSVNIPIVYGNVRDLQISASPGPQSIARTTGGTDDRSVSVYVSGLSFTFPKR